MAKKKRPQKLPPSVLRKWLERGEHTQQFLADAIGCSVNYVCNLVNRKHKNVSTAQLKRLHEATGIPYETLVADLLLGFEDRGHEGAA